MNATGSEQGHEASGPDHDLAPPPAAAMIEAMRALGYSFQAAMADIVDNSISAGAGHISITTHWAGEQSWISILDDGRGMNREELINAMRPGSFNPLLPRLKGDLGRFGMGLKTASFSQCRRLTVASRKEGNPIEVRRWDLDHVASTGEWQLLRSAAPDSEHHLAALDSLAHGTLVLWELPDRLVGHIPPGEPAMKRATRQFFDQLNSLEDHLSSTFHRYLRAHGRRTIVLNGKELEPWDPLLGGWESIAQLPEESLRFEGTVIKVQGTILPHPSRIEADRLDEAAGPAGWNRQQGFHVYRDGRLLSAGGWLGLGLEQDDRYRLARVRVDIPSTLDRQWGVDIRKSRVTIPPALREDLKRIARMTREHALNVYRQRSRSVPTPQPGEPVSLWLINPAGQGRYGYRINREHPLVEVLRQGDAAQRSAVDAFIDLTVRTLPVERIWMTGPEEHPASTPTLSPADIDLARRIRNSLITSGMSPGQAMLRLSMMDPYADFPAADLEKLLDEEI